ncbi:MAG TPA: hypothetical protein VGL56_14870 [Fimbriimonadaceae bacterium]|jgi:hypothetical protein
MTTLKVLKNFGYRGAGVAPGDVIDWDTATDGDTMGAFVAAGLCEVVEAVVASEDMAVKVKVATAEPISAAPVSTR